MNRVLILLFVSATLILVSSSIGVFWVKTQGESAKSLLVDFACERDGMETFRRARAQETEEERMTSYFHVYNRVLERKDQFKAETRFFEVVSETEPENIMAFTDWIYEGISKACPEEAPIKEEVRDFVITFLFVAGTGEARIKRELASEPPSNLLK